MSWWPKRWHFSQTKWIHLQGTVDTNLVLMSPYLHHLLWAEMHHLNVFCCKRHLSGPNWLGITRTLIFIRTYTHTEVALIFCFLLMYPQKLQFSVSGIFYHKLLLHSDVYLTVYGTLFSLLYHQHAILFLQLCCHCRLEESTVSLSSLSVDFTVPLSTYNLLQNFSITLDEPIKTNTITPFSCISCKLI